MRLGTFALYTVLLSTIPALAATTTRAHRGSTAAHKTLAKHSAKPKLVGQRTIDDERATEIQAALIKAGYLSGEPSGHWDAESIAAMTRVQADNGWQTKLVPDSRALIKLGLGPASASSPASGASPASPPPPAHRFLSAQRSLFPPSPAPSPSASYRPASATPIFVS